MAMQVKRVGLIKHQIICDNIWEYLSIQMIILTFCVLVATGCVSLIKYFLG